MSPNTNNFNNFNDTSNPNFIFCSDASEASDSFALPVIYLSSNTLINGSGLGDDPFRIIN